MWVLANDDNEVVFRRRLSCSSWLVKWDEQHNLTILKQVPAYHSYIVGLFDIYISLSMEHFLTPNRKRPQCRPPHHPSPTTAPICYAICCMFLYSSVQELNESSFGLSK